MFSNAVVYVLSAIILFSKQCSSGGISVKSRSCFPILPINEEGETCDQIIEPIVGDNKYTFTRVQTLISQVSAVTLLVKTQYVIIPIKVNIDSEARCYNPRSEPEVLADKSNEVSYCFERYSTEENNVTVFLIKVEAMSTKISARIKITSSPPQTDTGSIKQSPLITTTEASETTTTEASETTTTESSETISTETSETISTETSETTTEKSSETTTTEASESTTTDPSVTATTSVPTSDETSVETTTTSGNNTTEKKCNCPLKTDPHTSTSIDDNSIVEPVNSMEVSTQSNSKQSEEKAAESSEERELCVCEEVTTASPLVNCLLQLSSP